MLVKYITGGLVGLRNSKTGEFVLPCVYDSMSFMDETDRFIRVLKGDKYGVYDTKDNKWIVDVKYKFISLFHFDIMKIINFKSEIALYHKKMGFISSFSFSNLFVDANNITREVYVEKIGRNIKSKYLLDKKYFNSIYFL